MKPKIIITRFSNREKMDEVLEAYDKHAKSLKKSFPKARKNVYSFAYWLFRYSGYVN